MASWTLPDSRQIARPVERKARGRQLSTESCRRLRDLMAALLVCGLGLSKPDARRVLEMGPVSEDHMRRRLDKLPRNAGTIMDLLRREARPGV